MTGKLHESPQGGDLEQQKAGKTSSEVTGCECGLQSTAAALCGFVTPGRSVCQTAAIDTTDTAGQRMARASTPESYPRMPESLGDCIDAKQVQVIDSQAVPNDAAPTKATPRECGLQAAAAALCAFLMSGSSIGMATYCFGMFVNPLAEEYPNWTRVQINVALTVGQIVQSFVSPFGGKALDRFGCRRVVPVMALFTGSGWLLVSYTESLIALYAAYALVYTGFPTNTMQQCGKIIGAWFPKSRGKVIGVVSAGNNVGGAVLVQLVGAMRWRDAALAFACIQFCAAFLYAVFVRDRPPTAPPKAAAVAKAPAADSGATSPLRSWRFAGMALALCLCYYTYVSVLTQLPPALIADGADPSLARGCLSLVGIVGVGSKLSFGFLADKFGAKRAMQISLVLQEGALGLLMLHGFLPKESRWPGLAWIAAASYGAGFGAVGAMIPLVTLEEYGVKIFGRASGLVGLTFLGPALVAPVVAGASFDLTGQYTLSFGVVAIVFLLAFLMLEILCRTAARPAPAEVKEKTLPGPEKLGPQPAPDMPEPRKDTE